MLDYMKRLALLMDDKMQNDNYSEPEKELGCWDIELDYMEWATQRDHYEENLYTFNFDSLSDEYREQLMLDIDGLRKTYASCYLLVTISEKTRLLFVAHRYCTWAGKEAIDDTLAILDKYKDKRIDNINFKTTLEKEQERGITIKNEIPNKRSLALYKQLIENSHMISTRQMTGERTYDNREVKFTGTDHAHLNKRTNCDGKVTEFEAIFNTNKHDWDEITKHIKNISSSPSLFDMKAECFEHEDEVSVYIVCKGNLSDEDAITMSELEKYKFVPSGYKLYTKILEDNNLKKEWDGMWDGWKCGGCIYTTGDIIKSEERIAITTGFIARKHDWDECSKLVNTIKELDIVKKYRLKCYEGQDSVTLKVIVENKNDCDVIVKLIDTVGSELYID